MQKVWCILEMDVIKQNMKKNIGLEGDGALGDCLKWLHYNVNRLGW